MKFGSHKIQVPLIATKRQKKRGAEKVWINKIVFGATSYEVKKKKIVLQNTEETSCKVDMLCRFRHTI